MHICFLFLFLIKNLNFFQKYVFLVLVLIQNKNVKIKKMVQADLYIKN